MSKKIATFSEIFQEFKKIANYANFIEAKINSAEFATIHSTSINDGKVYAPNIKSEDIVFMQNISNIAYYRPIYSHRKFMKYPIICVKKAIRKCLNFLIAPILEDIRNVNLNNADTFRRQMVINNSLMSNADSLESKLTELQEKIVEMEQKLESYILLSDENTFLKKQLEYLINKK